MMKNLMISLLASGLIVSCGSSDKAVTTETAAATESVNTEVARTNDYMKDAANTAGNAVASAMGNTSGAMSQSGLLANARPGECYSQIVRPPKFECIPEKVLVKPESYSIKTVAPTYKKVTKTVVVKEASEKIKTIPATYKTVAEEVVIRPASSKLVAVPAKYKTVTKKIEVAPATKTWKKGTGDYKAGDNAQNDILCLVEVPAKFKTIKERVLVSAASTKEVAIPAITKKIKRTVVNEPARTEKIIIPAVTKKITVNEIATPAREIKNTIPAEYKTVNKKVIVAAGETTWGRILCKTNQDKQLVLNLQQKLKKSGHNPGGVDGFLGAGTYKAVRAYQKKNGLAVGGVTYETLSHLGINM